VSFEVRSPLLFVATVIPLCLFVFPSKTNLFYVFLKFEFAISHDFPSTIHFLRFQSNHHSCHVDL